jgi:6-pyruvoyltetrahydropterin/6-carboxytetrahydropterin synthase
MYTITVKRRFRAFHFLIGGNLGKESERHAHRYEVAARLEGYVLDRHGYLVDITAVEKALEGTVARYRGRTLNDLPEFAGLNPSIEHFSRIICRHLCAYIDQQQVQAVTVTVAENRDAAASFRGFPRSADDRSV